MYNNFPYTDSFPRREPEGAYEIEIRVRALEKKMALLAAEYKAEESGNPKSTNHPTRGLFAGLLGFFKTPRRQLASVTRK